MVDEDTKIWFMSCFPTTQTSEYQIQYLQETILLNLKRECFVEYLESFISAAGKPTSLFRAWDEIKLINRFMYIAHKFRLNPTEEQISVLESWSHINRFVWNHFLTSNKWRYELDKKFVFYHEMATTLPILKKEYEFLKEPPSQSLQSILQRLEGSIKRVFQLGNGFPHYKSRKKGDMPSISIPQTGTQIQWNKKQVKIPKLGWVKWKKHRSLAGKLISTTTKYEGGHWWCVVLCETNKPTRATGTDDVVGLDLGLKDWIVTSDGEVFNIHPKLLEKEEKVKKEQKSLSNKTKGSKNRLKQRVKLQRAWMKVKYARNDNAHKASGSIAKNYSFVAMEDLNIKGMIKNRCLARKIAQVSWGQLKNYLSYKTKVKLCDRWYPSSKTCCFCGCVKDKMPLNIRTYECESCKQVIDRDLNAAINIKQITFGTKENYACGDTSVGEEAYDSFRHVSLKQEKFEMSDGNIAFDQEAYASLGHG